MNGSNKFYVPRGPKIEYAIKDPAIEEWAFYRENTHRYFRMNPKIARKGIVWMVIVPFVTYKLIRWSQIQMDEQNPRSEHAVSGRRYI
jgi:hypothetical protein